MQNFCSSERGKGTAAGPVVEAEQPACKIRLPMLGGQHELWRQYGKAAPWSPPSGAPTSGPTRPRCPTTTKRQKARARRRPRRWEATALRSGGGGNHGNQDTNIPTTLGVALARHGSLRPNVRLRCSSLRMRPSRANIEDEANDPCQRGQPGPVHDVRDIGLRAIVALLKTSMVQLAQLCDVALDSSLPCRRWWPKILNPNCPELA